MSDETPRVDSDNRSYPRPEYAEEIVFEGSRHVVISPEAYEELYEIARTLERELNAANKRIKRMEAAGDELSDCADQIGWTSCESSQWIKKAENAVKEWLKAKEAKL